MALAGGVFAMGACKDTVPSDEGGDATGGTRITPRNGGASGTNQSMTTCGNANPDPCICDRPSWGSPWRELCVDKTACEARGRWWSEYLKKCDDAVPDGSADASPQDGNQDGSDAGNDAQD
jgi:hypothetical protein